jgi:hypothetical protein
MIHDEEDEGVLSLVNEPNADTKATVALAYLPRFAVSSLSSILH